MNITAMTAMALMAGSVAHGKSATRPAEWNVIVCIEHGMALLVTTGQAEAIASKMFAGIGVTIDWRRGLPGCPAQGIQISVSDRTPESFMPGSLAFARPYEGIHVRLFYDRIADAGDAVLLPRLLAHVLVHEITHILQKICRHSAHGVMKALWEQKDYSQMRWKPLTFADEDIDLIRSGLTAQAARVMVASR
jgi:hypothetical protein